MKIVNIHSGLGNQMFQYAFYLSLKKRYPNEQFKIDLSWFDDCNFHNGYELERIFEISEPVASKKEVLEFSSAVGMDLSARIKRRLIRKKTEVIEEPKFYHKFNGKYLEEVEGYSYFSGYWQEYRYFDWNKNSILEKFKFKEIKPDDELNYNVLRLIDSPNCNCVSIHVRRGDRKSVV